MRQLTIDDIEQPHTIVRAHAHKTEADAAQKALGASGSQRRRVYDYIVYMGIYGATDEELQEALSLRVQSETPRRNELERAGFITNSGRTRPTSSGSQAIVWILNGQPINS